MSTLDRVPAPGSSSRPPAVVHRPPPVLRWVAAAVLALPQLLGLVGVAVGSVGLTAPVVLQVLVVLALATLVGLGHRWACAAVAVLGLAAVVAASIGPGMLSLAFWVFGGLDVVIGVSLLLASRPDRTAGGAVRP